MGRAAVYSDNEYNNEIVGLKVFKVEYQPSSRIIGAPVENGMTIFDNKVIDPPKVVVTCSVSDLEEMDVLRSVNAIERMLSERRIGEGTGLDDRKYLFSVSDGKRCYSNLMLRSFVQTRDADKYDLLNYVLSFDKILVVQSSNGGLVGDNSDTQNNGHQQGEEV